MVFCRQCRTKVEDCPHFVQPIDAQRIRVFDAKVQTLAYDTHNRILEIGFKSGQIWQLFEVPQPIYKELCDSTISSFLRFIAQRYRSAPVRTGNTAVSAPQTESCPECATAMLQVAKNASDFDKLVRVLWRCPKCGHQERRSYGTGAGRERKQRWH